ncbi:MAG: hypothetical protein KF773_40620 [Deltaproteobacteria bacterium]|nr:hypothetical protein [Deltaproteobacteria bacterium]MCW5808072.1 hypothetical protein [Deltaproteobacteria bacterium]
MRNLLATTLVFGALAHSVAMADTAKKPEKEVIPPLVEPAAKPPKTPATDYAKQALDFYRVAACGPDRAIPSQFTAAPIDRHCKEVTETYATYKKAWVDKAVPFINELRPKDAPKTVVYPFGGGDLSSALAAFPDATEITTISLESAGDVRVIDTIKQATLTQDLGKVAFLLGYLYKSAHSTTDGLQQGSHSELSSTLAMALSGMVVHGLEPVSLRYFDIQGDGTLRYLSNEELDLRVAEYAATKRGKTPPKVVTHYWYEQDTPFNNVEITFRPRGDAKAAPRTYRHIVANLDDPHLDVDDRVIKHLRLKGKVSVMTKAASFLLWYDDFTKIRNHLLATTAWMISDASGIPPSYAEPAGFEHVTYGEFAGPYFVIDAKGTRHEFVKLWKSQPKRPLAFRFGYPDANKAAHLMVMRPKAASASTK